jgi:hypothetical protein
MRLHFVPPIQPGRQIEPRPLQVGPVPANAARLRLPHHVELVLARKSGPTGLQGEQPLRSAIGPAGQRIPS